jgi:hypothetical protein
LVVEESLPQYGGEEVVGEFRVKGIGDIGWSCEVDAKFFFAIRFFPYFSCVVEANVPILRRGYPMVQHSPEAMKAISVVRIRGQHVHIPHPLYVQRGSQGIAGVHFGHKRHPI